MASLKLSSFLVLLLAVAASAELSPNFYEKSCPGALATIRETVKEAVAKEARMGGSLLRLHFHDCFVNGCDASLLLDDNATFTGEKSAIINKNSARGFEVIDEIKSRLEKICPRVVSCADIIAVTARDSVAALGGPAWDVLLGRRDSVTASVTTANSLFPLKFDFESLVAIFTTKGFTAEEMVALSGAHTIGLATCRTFRARIYKETNINTEYAAYLKSHCPPTAGAGDFNHEPLDVATPTKFDNAYYTNLLSYKGLLPSDQLIYSNKTTDSKVLKYSSDNAAFFTDFGKAMIKMGNIEPLIGNQGVIRTNCRVPN